MSRSGSSARIVLDTSTYSFLRVGHEEVLEAVASAPAVLVPTIVLGELEAGFLLGSRRKENRLALEEFLGEPFVAIIPVTHDVARAYGKTFAALRRQGTPIPTNDVWIAACTVAFAATLITFDTDFQKVPNLACVVLED